MNQSSLLHQLQLIDIEIEKGFARINEIHSIIESDTTISEAENLVTQSKEKCDNANRKLLAAEHDVNLTKQKIQLNESNLYSGIVKNPKELQDLQKELKSLKNRLDELENIQLEKLIHYEELDETLQLKIKKLSEVKSNFATMNSQLIAEYNNIESNINRLENEKTVTLSSILDENLNIYNNLRKTKRGIAVAKIKEDTCSVCGTLIRPSEQQLARSPKQLAYCSSCGRILFSN